MPARRLTGPRYRLGPWRRDVESQHGDVNHFRRIIFVAKLKPKAGLAPPSFIAMKIRVRDHSPRDSGQYLREILVPVEDDDGRLGVSPEEVPQQLVDWLGQLGWTSPKLAFGNKNIPPIRTDENVCLTLIVERLTGSAALVVAVQRDAAASRSGKGLDSPKKATWRLHAPNW
jgi:hypothetical protein